jgi:hypothetical protein
MDDSIIYQSTDIYQSTEASKEVAQPQKPLMSFLNEVAELADKEMPGDFIDVLKKYDKSFDTSLVNELQKYANQPLPSESTTDEDVFDFLDSCFKAYDNFQYRDTIWAFDDGLKVACTPQEIERAKKFRRDVQAIAQAYELPPLSTAKIVTLFHKSEDGESADFEEKLATLMSSGVQPGSYIPFLNEFTSALDQLVPKTEPEVREASRQGVAALRSKVSTATPAPTAKSAPTRPTAPAAEPTVAEPEPEPRLVDLIADVTNTTDIPTPAPAVTDETVAEGASKMAAGSDGVAVTEVDTTTGSATGPEKPLPDVMTAAPLTPGDGAPGSAVDIPAAMAPQAAPASGGGAPSSSPESLRSNKAGDTLAKLAEYAKVRLPGKRDKLLERLSEKSGIENPDVIIEELNVKDGVAFMKIVFKNPINNDEEEFELAAVSDLPHTVASHKTGDDILGDSVLKGSTCEKSRENRSALENLFKDQILDKNASLESSDKSAEVLREERANELTKKAYDKKLELDRTLYQKLTRKYEKSKRGEKKFGEFANRTIRPLAPPIMARMYLEYEEIQKSFQLVKGRQSHLSDPDLKVQFEDAEATLDALDKLIDVKKHVDRMRALDELKSDVQDFAESEKGDRKENFGEIFK